ncbi:hypothetical protein NVX19_003626 [Salmonella enterica]|nr:hypothetical protein [Salmonella enterica]
MKKLLAKLVVLVLFARPFHLILGRRWTLAGSGFLYVSLQKYACAIFSICYYLSRRTATDYNGGEVYRRAL